MCYVSHGGGRTNKITLSMIKRAERGRSIQHGSQELGLLARVTRARIINRIMCCTFRVNIIHGFKVLDCLTCFYDIDFDN